MASAEQPDPNDLFANPTRECNLVMKGGITSGIVYPPAVLELAPRYRFRQIGGASAGAIAAAITAAAEYGRADGGFLRLARVNDHLSQPASVRALFQPGASTRPMFEVLLALMSRPPAAGARGAGGARAGAAWLARAWRAVTTPVRVAWAYAASDALVVLPVVALAAGWGLRHGPERALALALAAFALCMLARLAWILVRVVPRHDFGLCRGTSREGAAPAALTNWLADELDRIAGLDPAKGPLTIAHLQRRDIDLRMMTTNVSVAEPFALPFEHRDLLFNVDDMARLFPARIVTHLVNRSYRGPRSGAEGLNRKGYYFLPLPGDLPAVFCARLSLSFPVLISAVPLYRVRLALRDNLPAAGADFDPAEWLERHWFSDGGISSNFPVHFFGRWMPRRPTFGIDLAEMPDDAFAAGGAPPAPELGGPDVNATMRLRPEYVGGDPAAPAAAEAVVLLKPNRVLHPEWAPIEGLFGFLGGIWETSHSFRDNMLMQLPGFRERVVRIRFASGEGGLNLSMSETAVARIREKGRRAGRLLRDDFDFDAHRWVHYLVLMAELEEGLNQMAGTLRAEPELLARFATREGGPYERSNAWIERAIARTQELAALVERWRTEEWGPDPDPALPSDHFRADEPRPNPELRLSPRV